MSTSNTKPSSAIVLSGGGARGAYEAGVLSYLFEKIYPELGPDFEFDTASGTSVGAIHAAYLAATSDLDLKERARGILTPWQRMSFDDVFKLTPADLIRLPLRMLGLGKASRSTAGGKVLGGIVDVSPVKNLVADVVPWDRLAANLERAKPGALAVACTEVNTGRVVVFMDGPRCDTAAWEADPNTHAIKTPILSEHVRASAAIPFLFPAVGIDGQHYLDGGLRANTPLSPAVRLRSERVLAIALRHRPGLRSASGPIDPKAITQPTFLMGKLLDILLMDQLEAQLRQLDVLNSILEQTEKLFGAEGLDQVNDAVRAKRGVAYRPVQTHVLRPSEDIGAIAASCYRKRRATGSSGNLIASLLTRGLVRGAPKQEADLLSYLYFDGEFTNALIALGREDARRDEERIAKLLSS
jgi:NTE family protein